MEEARAIQLLQQPGVMSMTGANGIVYKLHNSMYTYKVLTELAPAAVQVELRDTQSGVRKYINCDAIETIDVLPILADLTRVGGGSSSLTIGTTINFKVVFSIEVLDFPITAILIPGMTITVDPVTSDNFTYTFSMITSSVTSGVVTPGILVDRVRYKEGNTSAYKNLASVNNNSYIRPTPSGLLVPSQYTYQIS